jgi:hypothetical protein
MEMQKSQSSFGLANVHIEDITSPEHTKKSLKNSLRNIMALFVICNITSMNAMLFLAQYILS